MKVLKYLSIFFLLLQWTNSPAISQPRQIYHDLTSAQKAFLDTLQHRTFLYFWHESNPSNGLVKDRSTKDSPCSIAAVGFGIVAWAIGAEHGWITREQAAERTLNALRFFTNSRQSKKSKSTGFQGFYYHFIDMKTGLRVWKCELSTIDTAWLLAGARFAAQYYDRENKSENEIRHLTDMLTCRVNWQWATLPNKGWHANLISMGWRPEDGFNQTGWFGYNEALYLYVLAAGSNYPGAEKAYQHWLRFYHYEETYPGLAHVIFPPLFGHQWSHMFIDFRGLGDEYMRAKGIDYFENSRRATLCQRLYAMDNPKGWVGYDSLCWGLTACDGPGSKYNFDDRKFVDYAARGASGPNLSHDDDGTIAPTAASGSIVFTPEAVIPTLMAMHARYGDKGLWGAYGFRDAFNPTINWYDPDYLGIDQGPIIIMIENFRTGLIWEYCMKDPLIQNGLKKLGIRGITP